MRLTVLAYAAIFLSVTASASAQFATPGPTPRPQISDDSGSQVKWPAGLGMPPLRPQCRPIAFPNTGPVIVAPPISSEPSFADIQKRLRDMTSSTSPFIDDAHNTHPPSGGGGGSSQSVSIAISDQWVSTVQIIFQQCEAQQLKQQQESGLAVMCIGAVTERVCAGSSACRRTLRASVRREFGI